MMGCSGCPPAADPPQSHADLRPTARPARVVEAPVESFPVLPTGTVLLPQGEPEFRIRVDRQRWVTGQPAVAIYTGPNHQTLQLASAIRILGEAYLGPIGVHLGITTRAAIEVL